MGQVVKALEARVRRAGVVSLTALVCFLLTPANTTAQGARGVSAVAGVVKDTSGGVLPGVTVEAASPALIENIPLISPFSEFDEWINQLDVRLARIFRLGRLRLQANFDVYNALNASPLSRSTTHTVRAGSYQIRFWMPACSNSVSSWSSN